MKLEERVAQIVSKISYKPGWEIQSYVNTYRPYELTIKIVVNTQDAFSCTYKLCSVTHDRILRICDYSPEYSPGGLYIDENMSDEAILFIIVDQVKAVELHEFQEFFKFAGECVTDPHDKHESHYDAGIRKEFKSNWEKEYAARFKMPKDFCSSCGNRLLNRSRATNGS